VKRKAFTLLVEALTALRRENKERLWSSMIKDTMKRIKPSFNETYHGYRTFSALLEDAQKQGILMLETDDRSGTYVVASFGEEKPIEEEGEQSDDRRRRRRSRGRRGTGSSRPSTRRERSESSTAGGSGSGGDRGDRSDNVRDESPPDRHSDIPRTFDDEFIPWPEE